jgi:hypothetical protein
LSCLVSCHALEAKKADVVVASYKPGDAEKLKVDYRCCLVLSCLVLSCLVLSCLVLSCLVLSCLVLSCWCLVSSCLVLSCFVGVLSGVCLVLSCLVVVLLLSYCCGCLFLSFGCLAAVLRLSCLVSCLAPALSCLVVSCLALSCLIPLFGVLACRWLPYHLVMPGLVSTLSAHNPRIVYAQLTGLIVVFVFVIVFCLSFVLVFVFVLYRLLTLSFGCLSDSYDFISSFFFFSLVFA